MRPKAFPQDSAGFEVASNKWGHLAQRWEVPANDILNDAVKRQILLDMAPAGIRVQLTLAGHHALDSWNRQGSSEGKQDGKASGKGKAKGKGCGKGHGKVNNVYEEQYDGDQHADSAAVSAVTRDEHWIMVLEREAPQADLSKETGFDVCAVTLRTASGQALTSYGRCDIHLQVPPIANPAKVTFEAVDVRYTILSVAGLVANCHRVTF